MIYALYTVVVLALIGCDQLLKSWTVSHLELGQSTGFLPGFLQLTRVHNYGAAWSSFSGKTVLLVAVTAVLLVAVAYLLLRRIVRHPLGVAAALLILGGGVGNIIDRIANCFPGIFRGALDVRASQITENMKIASAYAIAGLVSDEELSADYILPKAFDPRLRDAVAHAAAEAARKDGVARI